MRIKTVSVAAAFAVFAAVFVWVRRSLRAIPAAAADSINEAERGPVS